MRPSMALQAAMAPGGISPSQDSWWRSLEWSRRTIASTPLVPLVNGSRRTTTTRGPRRDKRRRLVQRLVESSDPAAVPEAWRRTSAFPFCLWCESERHTGPHVYLPQHLLTQYSDPTRAKHCCWGCFSHEHGGRLRIPRSWVQGWTNRQWFEVVSISQELARNGGRLQVEKTRGMQAKARMVWQRVKEARAQGVDTDMRPRSYEEACQSGISPELQALLDRQNDHLLYAAHNPEELR